MTTPKSPERSFRLFRVGEGRTVLLDVVIVAPADSTIEDIKLSAYALGFDEALHDDTEVEEV